jgi:molecular chaperone DnaK
MVDYTNITRDSRRVPLETRVQFKFDRFSGFLSDFSANISPGGMFIRTQTPQPQGAVLEFEFRLGDGFELIRGRGEVVWLRPEDEGPTRPAGMGLRFLDLSQGSKELIYKIVDHHIMQGGTPFDLTQRPPDPIPAPPPPVAQERPAARPLAPPVWPAAPPPAPAPPEPASALIFEMPPDPPSLMAKREPEPFPEPATPATDAEAWLPSPLEEPGFEPSAYEPSRDDWMKSREPLPEEVPFPELAPPASFSAPEPEVPAMTPPPAEEAVAAAPMFASTLQGARTPRRSGGRALKWAALAVLVALGAGAVLFRDTLFELMGLGGGDEVAQATPPARRTNLPAPALPEDTPAAAPAPAPATSEATPEATPATPETEVTPVRPAPTPVPAAPAPTPAPPRKAAPMAAIPEAGDSGPAATALEKISFEPAFGGTDIILSGNGALRAGGYTRSRLDGNPPRELIRISGIKRPYPSARVVVGTPEVLQVRTGLHPGGELFVVLDLASPKVTVTRVDEGDGRLRIHLQRQ